MDNIIIIIITIIKVGSVCRVKRFTAWSRNSLKDDRNSQMMPDQVALLGLRQKQRLLRCGFRSNW
jgi:hypothetical protein